MTDGRAAIEFNLQALIRIVAGIAAMAGLGAFASPLVGEDGSAGRGEAGPLAEAGEGVLSATRPHPEVRAEGEPRRTLARHLYRAVLKLLRPAESAARRLIIAMARGLAVTLPPARPRKEKPVSTGKPAILRDGVGTGIILPRGWRPPRRRGAAAPAARPLAFRLADTQKPWRWVPRPGKLPRVGFSSVLVPLFNRVPVRRPPMPDDPVDATRLTRRIAALDAALGDLPGEARRFALWRARRERALARGRLRNPPLRPGRPPGGRLWRYDPTARRRRHIREVDEVLAHAHALAVYALERRDTS